MKCFIIKYRLVPNDTIRIVHIQAASLEQAISGMGHNIWIEYTD